MKTCEHTSKKQSICDIDVCSQCYLEELMAYKPSGKIRTGVHLERIYEPTKHMFVTRKVINASS